MSVSLEGSVRSLRTAIDQLDSSISILDSGVNDFPRLTKVLATTRHFELTSETQLQAAQATLLAEIQPEVNNLLSRVDSYLQNLELREYTLLSRERLQADRLATALENKSNRPIVPSTSVRQQALMDRRKARQSQSAASSINHIKIQQLLNKKERLSYAVERLEMQVNQQARKKRMSMAPSSLDRWDDDAIP